MPRYYDTNRPTKPNANGPAYPVASPPILPVQPPEGYPAIPYPGDLTAGDGADRSFRPNPMGSFSTNVPQPDNKGPVNNTPGDGKNGMAG